MLRRFNGWLDKWMVDALKRLAKEDDRPVGWIVRQAVREYLERRKANVSK
jgi:predicted transcriptional regulator